LFLFIGRVIIIRVSGVQVPPPLPNFLKLGVPWLRLAHFA